MKKRTSIILTLLFSLHASIIGQTPAPALPQEPQTGEDEVVRVTTNLVQLDAVVTDKNGRQVTDLQPDDFEVLEDGRPQAITNFSYIETGSETASRVPVSTRVGNAPPVASIHLRPEQVGRTIILVADDLGLSFESTARLRDSMKRFVDEKVQPGDLVAIARTGAGVGALQQLTINKRQLYAAIDRIRWTVDSREGVTPLSVPIFSMLKKPAVYSLNALSFIVKGLQGLPGRKSVIFFTDDFRIFPSITDMDLKLDNNRNAGSSGSATKKMEEMMERAGDPASRQKVEAEPGEGFARLVDRANQASAVIYTVDTRGLPPVGISAEVGGSPSVGDVIASSSLGLFNTQLGLKFLAEQTGGLSFVNNNDIDLGIQRVLDDLRGYYLIGYRPSEGTLGRSRFHKINIRVRRTGLQVRSRKGFFGMTEEERRAVPRTRSEELIAAMTSPFQAGGIALRLTSLFSDDPATGAFVRSLLHIDARALKFQADTEGWQTAKMEVAAMTFNESGKIVDQITREETLQVRGASYERLLRNGLSYSFDVPVKHPGNYQLRLGVRDPATKLVGAASQFIEVPDLKKNRLALSGIYARGIDPAALADAGAKNSVQAKGLLSGPPEIGEAGGAAEDGERGVQPGAATRRLRHGMALDYNFLIFNPQLDKSTRRPNLLTQLTLFRNGQQVFTKNTPLIAAGNQTDFRRVVSAGRLELGAEMQPGEYILQIVITDLLADEKYRTATQWIDFEIVK